MGGQVESTQQPRVRVGINGALGRIGLMALSAYYELGPDRFWNIEIATANLSGHPLEYGVDRLRFDTAHGPWHRRVRGVEVSMDGDDTLVIGQDRIKTVSTKDVPYWGGSLEGGGLNCPLVLDCTGKNSNGEKAARHLATGAQRFLISAPPKDGPVDRIVVHGINENTLHPTDRVISAASCTTTALAPMVQAILDADIGIKVGWMMSIHSATASQFVVDGNDPKDRARARSVLGNVFQTKTGAAKMIGKVIPSMEGVLSGTAWRVPTVDGSSVQLFFQAGRDNVTVEQIRNAFTAFAAKHPHLMKVMDRDIVSTDIVHEPAAVVIDLKHVYVQTGPDGHEQIVVTGWYDNEFGYAVRFLDLANFAAGQMLAANTAS